jgi:hypothetical protein
MSKKRFVRIAATTSMPACVSVHIVARRTLANAAYMTLQQAANSKPLKEGQAKESRWKNQQQIL